MVKRLWKPASMKYAPSLETFTVPRCPHCKKESRVYRAMRVTGKGRLVWDRTGRLQPTVLESLDLKPHSLVIRCELCRKKRHDLEAMGEKLKQADV